MKSSFVIIFFLAVTLAILGPMLLPGYVLTLDMAWPETLTVSLAGDGFLNALPLSSLLAGLGALFPSWVVQKVMLVTLVFCMLYLPYRFLPYLASWEGRVSAGLLYTLNPFVYSRMLAGQWMVLLGYALLPLVLYALVGVTERRDTRSGVVLAGVLVLVGCVSIHFLYLSIALSAVWLGAHAVREGLKQEWAQLRSLVCVSALAMCMVGVVSLYWIVPALMRDAPIEARFDATHLAGFSASENHLVPTLLNMLVLGGFWAEGMGWRYTFVWPHDTVGFWLATLGVFTLVIYGASLLYREPRTRFVALLLVCVGVASYILALGVWGGILSGVNEWWYAHVPGWTGLRDSHKVAGLLALVYALFAGVAVSRLRERVRGGWHAVCLVGVLGCGMLGYGVYHWGGFHGQLHPVWYPASWYEVRDILDTAPVEDKVLALPWRGYYSLEFADQRIVGNPAPRFFGIDRVYSGRSVEVGGVYDQEVAEPYRSLDTFIHSAHTLSEEALREVYNQHGIRYLLIVNNTEAERPWLIPSRADGQDTPSDDALLGALLRVPHVRKVEGAVTLYEFTRERAQVAETSHEQGSGSRDE